MKEFGIVDSISVEGQALPIWRRLYVRIISLFILLIIVNFVDRSNVGVAALQMNEQLGFTPRIFALGASVFFLGYLACQIPANLVVHRFGPRRVIATIAVCWGLTTAGMALVYDTQSFVLMRLLLSIAEAGLMPGATYYISQYFPQAFRARAMGSLYIATQLAFVIGAPLTGALLQLRPAFGLQPWQLMFLIEALPAILLGFIVLRLMPDRPSAARGLTDAERKLIEQDLAREQSKASGQVSGGLEVLRNGRLWLLFLAYICIGANFLSMALWLPQIVDHLQELNPFQVGLISATPYLLTAIGMYVAGRDSDRRRIRGPYVVWGSTVGAAGIAISAYSSASPVIALCALTVGLTAFASMNGPFWSFATSFLRGRAAAIGIGLLSMGGSIGGFLATNMLGYFRERFGNFEAGLYVMAATLFLGAILMWLASRGERELLGQTSGEGRT